MPFLGLGLHTIIAIFFAVHVLRTGREWYWLAILFMFPLLGSIVYFLVVYLPDSRIERGLRSLSAAAARSLDPGGELRAARSALELTPTVQNRMRLAEALIAAGDTAAGLAQYDQCLTGPLAKDPETRFAAARAKLNNGDPQAARDLLDGLRRELPEFRVEEVTLALARALAALGENEAARAQFEFATTRFGSVEARVEYAIWAKGQGDLETAQRLRDDLNQSMRHWSRQTRSLNRPIVERLEAAFS